MHASDGFAFLSENRGRILPVVGAGLALEDGAPSSGELALALGQAVADAGGPVLTGNVYSVTDGAEAEMGADWVQERGCRGRRSEGPAPDR